MLRQEDKEKCAVCSSTEQLRFHHETYSPERILVLCASCHKKEHKRNKSVPSRPINFNSKEIQYGGCSFMIRIDEEIVRLLRESFPELKELNATKTVDVALRKFLREALNNGA